jgi:pimeloyl-ACP methyl ester carboxylesterase
MLKRLALGAGLFVLLALGGLAAAGLTYRPDLSIPPGLAGRQVNVAGIPLRVLQEGTGRDILMIHGSPGILEDFDDVAAKLRDSYRVTRFDRPGHGFSADAGEYSHTFNARTALAVIETLGLDRVLVVGHSFGGSTALALAGLKSPRVSSIVVLDSAVYAPIRPRRAVFRYLRLPVIGVGLAQVVPRGRREAGVRESLAGEFRSISPPESFRELRASVFSQPKVLHAIANEHWQYGAELESLSAGYGGIEMPVHVVSQRDDPARRAAAERLQKELRHGDLLLVSPSGHFVQVEQAAAVTDVIRRAAGAN